MRVVDTSAWIEHLIASPTGKKLKHELPEPDRCLVPTIVQLELSKWLSRELGEPIAETFIAFTGTCLVIELDTSLALMAANLCRLHKLATADAVIYATAQLLGVELLTCDAHFKDLPGVIFIPKVTAKN